MLLYGTMLLIAVAISIGINLWIMIPNGEPLGMMFLWIFLAILICGGTWFVISMFTRFALPRNYFDARKKRWHTFKFEEKIYRFLRVKKWKDKIPELGNISGFGKKKIEDPNNPIYLYKFLTENCLADSLHFFSIFAGVLVFVLVPSRFILTIALPIFIVNTIMNTMSWMVQRFLRPKMVKMYERLLRLEKQKVESGAELEESLVNAQ